MINKATIAMMTFIAATISQSWGSPLTMMVEAKPVESDTKLAQDLPNSQTHEASTINKDQERTKRRTKRRVFVHEGGNPKPAKPSKPGCRTMWYGCDGHEDECCSGMTCDKGYGIGPKKVCKLEMGDPVKG